MRVVVVRKRCYLEKNGMKYCERSFRLGGAGETNGDKRLVILYSPIQKVYTIRVDILTTVQSVYWGAPFWIVSNSV